MNEKSRVREIIDAEAKSGVSAKTNKPWSQAKVELENGEQVWIFNPIEVSQEVESYTTERDGTSYTNWRLVRVDPKHDEIMTALRKIYGAITGAETAPTGLEKAREVNETIKARVEEKKEDKVDEVYTDEDEPFDLSQIPF